MEEYVQALKSDRGTLRKWPHFFTPLLYDLEVPLTKR